MVHTAELRPESIERLDREDKIAHSPSLDLASVERLDQFLKNEDTARVVNKSPMI